MQLTYENFILEYKKCLSNIDKAIKLDAENKYDQALDSYKKLIQAIDILLKVDVSLPADRTDDEIYRKKLFNLLKLRDNISDSVARINNRLKVTQVRQEEILIYFENGCQYCKMEENSDQFNNPSQLSSLSLVKLVGSESEEGYMQIGEWRGKLEAHITPILVDKRGVIVYINPREPTEKVAIILPVGTNEKEYKKFIETLSELSFMVYEDFSESLSTGEIVGENLEKIGHVVSEQMVKGAVKLGQFIDWGSDKVCDNLEQSCSKNDIDPRVKTGLEYARKGSHGLVEVSGKALSLLLQGTQFVASKAAPHIKNAIENVVPDDWSQRSNDSKLSKLDQVGCVAGAGLKGVADIFDGLQKSAIIFGKSFTRGSSSIVRHKYGEEYANATENALYSAGNLGMTAYVSGSFTKKGILKAAAKVTAKEVADSSVSAAKQTRIIEVEPKRLDNK